MMAELLLALGYVFDKVTVREAPAGETVYYRGAFGIVTRDGFEERELGEGKRRSHSADAGVGARC